MGKPSQSLAGRTCVITGAGSGIGRALAERLSGQGCPVAICDWNEENLAETADGLSGEVLSRKLDVADRQGVMSFAAEVAQWKPSQLGLVINNAGVTVSQLAAEAAPEDDEWVMNVNFWGVVHGTRSFLPLLLEQDSGTLANVSSIYGFMGWPAQSAYCASKHAVRGYSEALRHELRDTNVSVAVVHPGGIKTNIVRNARFHMDDLGRTDRTKLEKDFDRVTITTPAKAAKTIQNGVEAGRARILIGPDAHFLSGLTRALPERYFDVIKKLEPLLRKS
jgi:NADP-dependent 3-hydroxy acid dehydrogenase YdfG